MNTDRFLGNANSPAGPGGYPNGQPARSAQSCYIASAPVADVLFDQLQYLVSHSGRDCPPECLECGRLERVKHWLLLPFRNSAIWRVDAR